MTSNVLAPRYSVKFYREGVYELIRFKRALFPHLPPKREEGGSVSGEKLSQAICRAKSVIFQVAFCNDWDFFFTGTIDKTKYNRFHLKDFYKSFTQWLRDYRKKYSCDLKYRFVPELHEDGAWHIHGFVRGIPEEQLCPFIRGLHPDRLVNGGYLNWPEYQKKFGFCSLAQIKDPERAAGYITKYVSKDLARCVSDYGAHMYRCSIGLARALSMGYVYQSYASLDAYLESENTFCSTGWVRDVDWSFWMEYIPADDELPTLEYPEDVPLLLFNVEVEQTIIQGYLERGEDDGGKRPRDL